MDPASSEPMEPVTAAAPAAAMRCMSHAAMTCRGERLEGGFWEVWGFGGVWGFHEVERLWVVGWKERRKQAEKRSVASR